jgi:superfamily II DNA/RNA helicase
LGVKVQYLHSEVDTLERVQILRDLRLGVYDVIVGINLLREGIDLPEVTLVAILDADKEGFLRSSWSLIQMVGRAARNIGGEVVMYADKMTDSMKAAIGETDRRRGIQESYNREHNIEPVTIVKAIHDINDRLKAVAESGGAYGNGIGPGRAGDLSELAKDQVEKLVAQMEAEMRQAARDLEFERAAALRDEVQEIRLRVLEEDASVALARAAERAAKTKAGGGSNRPGPARAGRTIKPVRQGQRRELIAVDGAQPDASDLDVTEVRVLAAEEPDPEAVAAAATASDWLPGIRDEHEDDGWAARWVERPTWDHTVTPNVIKRTGQRSPRGRRGR